MQPTSPIRHLILACGNTLRGDDGVGPQLAAWASERFQNQSEIRIISCQQWTPELAEEVARAEFVLFLDSSLESEPGKIRIATVSPQPPKSGLATHHLGASELLAFAQQLYGALPRSAILLTIGADSMELKEGLSDAMQAALPEARAEIEKIVLAS